MAIERRDLKELPESPTRPPGNRYGVKGRFPWSKWSNGSVWELTVGVDFDLPVSSFRSVAARAAARAGKLAQCRWIASEGKMYLRFTPGDGHVE